MSQVSLWKLGCEDAKAGKPMASRYSRDNGYINGYYFGQHGRGHPNPSISYLYGQWGIPVPRPEVQPDPPLKNPYIEGVEAIEGILKRLQTFAKEFPQSLDKAQQDTYLTNLLEVRNTLHRFWLAED